MNNEWPPLSEFQATIGRLATDDDIREGRAAFLLQSDGERIGSPVQIDLPARAWYIDDETSERRRCIIIQAEETGESRYFGAWLIDSDEPFVGFDSDFEILSDQNP